MGGGGCAEPGCRATDTDAGVTAQGRGPTPHPSPRRESRPVWLPDRDEDRKAGLLASGSSGHFSLPIAHTAQKWPPSVVKYPSPVTAAQPLPICRNDARHSLFFPRSGTPGDRGHKGTQAASLRKCGWAGQGAAKQPAIHSCCHDCCVLPNPSISKRQDRLDTIELGELLQSSRVMESQRWAFTTECHIGLIFQAPQS